MALEILQQQNKAIRELSLVPSGGGAFEISIDGKKIYSKLQSGEFPDLKAIQNAVQQAIDS